MELFVSYIWIVRLFRKNISRQAKVVSQVRCDFNEKGERTITAVVGVSL